MKSIIPQTDPCDIPKLTFLLAEKYCLFLTLPLLKYLRIQLFTMPFIPQQFKSPERKHDRTISNACLKTNYPRILIHVVIENNA